MKTLREVIELTGVSRRALQGYEEVGLVTPSKKTEAGYWMYDDEAIQKIMIVRMFSEVGYTRNAIKQILDKPDLCMGDEMSTIIGLLEDKKRQIEGMIKFARECQVISKLPTSTLTALGKADVTKLYKKLSFSESMKDCVGCLSQMTDDEAAECEKYMPLYYHLYAIGRMTGYSPSTKLAQNCVHELYKYLISLVVDEDETKSESEIYCEEEVDAFIEFIENDILSDQEIAASLTTQCNDNAIDYIKETLKIFKKLVLNDYWNKR